VYIFCNMKVISGFVIVNKHEWRAPSSNPRRVNFFSSPRLSFRPWDPLINLFNGHWAYFPKLGHGADNSPPPNIDVKNVWSYTSNSHIYLHCEDKKNFTLYIYQCFF